MNKLLFLFGSLLIATAVLAQDIVGIKEGVYWRDVALMAIGIVTALVGIVFRMHLNADKERREGIYRRLNNIEANYVQVLTMQANVSNICRSIKTTELRISRIEGALIPSGWTPRQHTGD